MPIGLRVADVAARVPSSKRGVEFQHEMMIQGLSHRELLRSDATRSTAPSLRAVRDGSLP